MGVSNLFTAVGAILALSAGAALAAEGCKCCKDMAADAEMSCSDKMAARQAPDSAPPAPTPPAPEASEPAGPERQ